MCLICHANNKLKMRPSSLYRRQYFCFVLLAVVQCSKATLLTRLPSDNFMTSFIICWTNHSSDCRELELPGLHVEKCGPASLCLLEIRNRRSQTVQMSPESLEYYCNQCTAPLQNFGEGNMEPFDKCQLQELPTTSCNKLISVLESISNAARGIRSEILNGVASNSCSSFRFMSCENYSALHRSRRGIGRGAAAGAFGKNENRGSEDGSNIVAYIAVGVAVVVFIFLVYWVFFRD